MAAVAITDLRQHLGYLKPSDIARIEEAYQFSDAAHQGQFRLSGHPYISHPVAVAEIVADWQADAQAVKFRKMLLAMARDVRVILIKLADRLHNMRTLDAVRPEKRRRVARETLEIYAPIANRLGLDSLFRELQELAFAN